MIEKFFMRIFFFKKIKKINKYGKEYIYNISKKMVKLFSEIKYNELPFIISFFFFFFFFFFFEYKLNIYLFFYF